MWTSALWPSRRMVSTMPSAVSGLTKHEAPSAARRAGRQQQAVGCAFEQPVLRVHRAAEHRDRLAHQRLRGLGRARLDDRAGAFVADRHRLVEPRGEERQRRPAGPCAVTTGAVAAAGRPWRWSCRRRRTAGRGRTGLIGVASTLTTTSSGPGSGIGTSASDSSSSPLLLIRERSCSPVVIVSLLKSIGLDSSPPGAPCRRGGEQETVDQGFRPPRSHKCRVRPSPARRVQSARRRQRR